MVETLEKVDLRALPLAPVNPLPQRQLVKALRAFHTGFEALRDADRPVTGLKLAPSWFTPQIVIATSEMLRSGKSAVDPKADAPSMPSRPFLECHVRRRACRRLKT